MESPGGALESSAAASNERLVPRNDDACRPQGLSGLKIAIDARKLGHGGIGVYVDNLVRGLLRNPEKLAIGVIAAPGAAARYAWRDDVDVVEDATPPYSMHELFRLGYRLRSWTSRYDLFHAPHFPLPFGVRPPAVMTLHDLIHIYHPERPFYPWIAGPMIGASLKRARRVVAVSRATLNDIERFALPRWRMLRDAPPKVRIIGNAIADEYLGDQADRSALPRQVSDRCGEYLLAVISTPKPHKGEADICAAYAELARGWLAREGSERRCPALVLAGQGIQTSPARALELSKGCGGEVIVVGRVEPEELRALFAAARALVIGSTIEGFGLPVLEAHARRIPVVMRPIPVLLELRGKLDSVARDLSIPSLTEAMREVLAHDPSDERVAALKAEQHSFVGRKFSLDAVAGAHLDVYAEALNG